MKKNLQNKIIPGILVEDIKDIKNNIKKLEVFAKENIENKNILKSIQIDICDGVFVKSLTYGKNPKEFKDIVKYVNTLDDKFEVQLDMMIKMKSFLNQEKSETVLDSFLETIENLKSGILIIHFDSMNIDEWDYLIETIKEYNKLNNSNLKIWPAFNYKNLGSENIEQIKDFIAFYKFKNIQIMGIKTIGKQGQKFLPDILDCVSSLKKEIKSIKIQIDGGCNIYNVEDIVNSGADNVVFGSQIFKGDVMENLSLVYK